jgi:hypothetical protein
MLRITRSSAKKAMTSAVTNLKTIKLQNPRKKKSPAECDLSDCHVLLEPMPKMTLIHKRPSDPPEDKLTEQTPALYMDAALRLHPDMKAPIRCVEDGDTPARPHPVGCVCNRCMENKVFSKNSPSYSSRSPCHSPPHPGSPCFDPPAYGADAEHFSPSAFFSNDTHTQPQHAHLYPDGSAEQKHAMQVDDDTEDYSTTDEAEQKIPQQPEKKSLMDPSIEGKQIQWDSDDDFAEKKQTNFEAAIQKAAIQETYQERRNRRRKEKRAQETGVEREIRLEKERRKNKERKERREAEKAAQLEKKPTYIEISEAEDDAEILD